jgi:hypothetical protein
MLMTMAKTLSAYWSGILACYDFPISTGPLEGMNNKIKTMKRQAYGFRDMECLKLKTMALHETRYALNLKNDCDGLMHKSGRAFFESEDPQRGEIFPESVYPLPFST